MASQMLIAYGRMKQILSSNIDAYLNHNEMVKVRKYELICDLQETIIMSTNTLKERFLPLSDLKKEIKNSLKYTNNNNSSSEVNIFFLSDSILLMTTLDTQ